MRSAFMRFLAAAIALVAVAGAGPVSAQQSVAIETHFRGLRFDDGLGPDVANVFLTPIAVRADLTPRLILDVYTAWGRGQVEQDDVVYELSGLVDSRVRMNYRVRDWASLSVAANLPTGNSQHDGEESVVASVLSSDLLGFRESTWGSGLGVTTGFATARRMGAWGIGLGASYRLAAEFEPVADTAIGYQPGNEMRIRAGVDRNFGESGTVSAGVTFQDFSDDQLEGRNLFQAGRRVSVDAAVAFRAGGSTWTLSGLNVWRENGDLFLDLVDAQGGIVGDTTLVTAKQRLTVTALSGSVPLGSRYRIRPSVRLRVQDREEVDGTTPGSGWLLGIGADLPLRLYGNYDLFPAVRYMTGEVEGASGDRYGMTGFTGTLTLRWRF